MHALHRDLDSQLRQTTKIYEDTFSTNQLLQSKFEIMSTNVNKLNVLKTELESKNLSGEQDISMLKAELNTKTSIIGK